MSHTHTPRWLLPIAILLTLTVAAGLRLARLPDLPLGLHYDEAANGILAAEIARGIEHPVFIPSYTGKEVLFFYWAAAWMRVLGEGTLALRLTAATAGICTVAAAAWSAWELLHHRRDAQWVGALTAAFLATSFWHLLLSRIGFRAITQPLLQALTVAALWRGLRLERKGWLALAGLLGGATLYTYLAARAFPLPLAVALLALLVADQGRRRTRLGQIALFGAAAALTAAPMAAYFYSHPAALTTRMGQVAARSWAEAWAGLRACLGMFFLRGDPYIRFNLPGRPLFGPLTASLFLAGLTLVVYRLARPAIRDKRHTTRALPLASSIFLLATPAAMLLPSALATGEITPSNLRSIGLLPFVYIFPAIALADLASIARPPSDVVRGTLTLLILAVLTTITATTFFRDWAASPGLYEAADGDLADAAAYLNQTDLTGTTPYVAAVHYRHPTLAFLADDYAAVKWLTGGQTLVFPADGAGVLILPRSADGSQSWIEDRLGADAHLPAPPGPDGQPAFHTYRVLAGATPPPTHPVTASFGHAATLLGYDLPGTGRSGGKLDAVVYWRAETQPQPGDLLPLARLTDPWGNVWGETHPFHYPAEQWTPGEVILDRLSVPVAAGAPPGEYLLEFGFYAASTGTSLPVLDPWGAYAGTGVELPLTLERAATPPDPSSLSIQRRLDITADVALTLLGVNLDTTTLQPGGPVRLTLFWQAGRAPEADLTVRLSLGKVTLYEGPPVHGTYPTGLWAAGEVVADRYDPRLTREAEPGAYHLLLTLLDQTAQPVLGPLSLGEVIVEETERLFEPPPMAHPMNVALGEQVELLGYDLEPEPPIPGAQATLTLYWRALTEMETSYTVFVHLLGTDGGMAAQHDGVPVGETYPTTLWVTGEVVTDPHVLDLPADLPSGTYTLEVGMYVLETGARLAVPGSADDALTLLAVTRQ